VIALIVLGSLVACTLATWGLVALMTAPYDSENEEWR
jgi:hypothetical protein